LWHGSGLKTSTREAHIPTMPNVRTKIPVVEVIAPGGQKSLWVAAVAKAKAVEAVKQVIPANCGATLTNDYPEVGNTPARRSAEGHAMTNPKRSRSSAGAQRPPVGLPVQEGAGDSKDG
jgi:hypothetical protein